jgi:hypothetical protein
MSVQRGQHFPAILGALNSDHVRLCNEKLRIWYVHWIVVMEEVGVRGGSSIHKIVDVILTCQI